MDKLIENAIIIILFGFAGALGAWATEPSNSIEVTVLLLSTSLLLLTIAVVAATPERYLWGRVHATFFGAVLFVLLIASVFTGLIGVPLLAIFA